MVHRLVILYLIRHGETPSNVQRRYLGWRNEAMSEQGRLQVMDLKKHLPALQKVYASDLDRCRETASILSQVVEETNRLREYNFGNFDGFTYEELQGKDEYKQWLNDMESITPPNGESLIFFKSRVLSFFAQLIDDHCYSNEPVAIITHGGVIRTMLHHWSNVSESMWDWAVAPGEAYKVILKKEGDQWILSQAVHITES
ncbi:histidine phosphatase family protein [Virgibacillus necropolis]|uniref:Phosphoglycerate mutase n=1 Tax=Virgibacillus necropolis TaxID=163877 RepID=A0A221MAK3_9BACI|nr:histidine phosphatase family protein [Virgibacillus necropolis]ASN04688.1 phosphoglycerate mutase [Virgibacillus necropolis]